jgi:hypothetical protein
MSTQNSRLQTVLGFQPEDLASNRAGYLGPQQRAKIETTKLQTLFGGAFFGVVLIIFFILVARDGFTGWPIFGMCFGTMLLMLIGAVWMQITWLNSDLAAGTVECVTGPVARTIRVHQARRNGSSYQSTTSRHYYVQVGEKNFKVLPQVYKVFEDGQIYEVFYLSKSNTIVGAEKSASITPRTELSLNM